LEEFYERSHDPSPLYALNESFKLLPGTSEQILKLSEDIYYSYLDMDLIRNGPTNIETTEEKALDIMLESKNDIEIILWEGSSSFGGKISCPDFTEKKRVSYYDNIQARRKKGQKISLVEITPKNYKTSNEIQEIYYLIFQIVDPFSYLLMEDLLLDSHLRKKGDIDNKTIDYALNIINILFKKYQH